MIHSVILLVCSIGGPTFLVLSGSPLRLLPPTTAESFWPVFLPFHSFSSTAVFSFFFFSPCKYFGLGFYLSVFVYLLAEPGGTMGVELQCWDFERSLQNTFVKVMLFE